MQVCAAPILDAKWIFLQDFFFLLILFLFDTPCYVIRSYCSASVAVNALCISSWQANYFMCVYFYESHRHTTENKEIGF